MFDVANGLKILHLIGVVLLIGNVTITAYWKVLSDRTRDPKIIAHAQRGVIIADWIWTLLGIILISIGGYGAAIVQGMPLLTERWLVLGQALFVISGLIWLLVLLPIQIRQSRAAATFALTGVIPDSYWMLARSWIIWGIVATVPLVLAIWVMVAKPG